MDIGGFKLIKDNNRRNMATINFTKFPIYGRNGKREGEKNMNLPSEEGFNFFDFVYSNGDRKSVKLVLGLEDDQDVEMTEEVVEILLPYINALNPGYIGASFEMFLKENGLWKAEYETK